MMMQWTKNIKNPLMKKMLEIAQTVSARKATVLIMGESGVGKELMAQFIHQNSQRSREPFVAINCAAVPENLLESELFGFEKGAFTGAYQTKPGKFEVADKGTFLLDEVSELPLVLQGKLLRVLQEGQIERLGSTQVRKVDVRVICTSNRNLLEMVGRGEFRQDLFYRLNVIPLNIPPLRERSEDLASLVHSFLKKVAEENEMEIKSLSEAAMTKISGWTWPGNIRELQNVIERSCLMSNKEILEPDDLQIDGYVQADQSEMTEVRPGMTLQEAERRLIMKTLQSTKDNKSQAARLLGISIRTLRNKLNEYKSNDDNYLQGGVS